MRRDGRRGPDLLGRDRECEALDRLLADTLDGQSRVLVLRGEAGAGKSALLDYLVANASDRRVVSAIGVESEMELSYSGLHQICAPVLDLLEGLPDPQREALTTVFGLSSGPVPDRFLVGLATLSLLAEAAERQPLLCIVDDAHWLDHTSAQLLGFVARRLLAERIGLVCAVRLGIGDHVLSGVAELQVGGLAETDARALLLSKAHGPLDAAVCAQIVAESRGNPLALVELPRTWIAAGVPGSFGVSESQAVASKIEQSYERRLLRLPFDTQLLVLAASAEPLGDPGLLEGAVERLAIDMGAAGPAIDAGLVTIAGRVEFAHPLVRSAAYRSAAEPDRHRVHLALAEATDPERDADRRTWHRAQGTAQPDEDVAAELEDSAGRAQARGGVAAAAAFLERAAALSPEPAARARRSLAAAEAKQLAGAPQAASRLLAVAADGSLDQLENALAERLRGQIALDLRSGGEAVPFLLGAARQLESRNPALARRTYLDALYAASFVSEEMLALAGEAARKAPPPEDAPSAEDLLLAGLAIRFTQGYAAAAGPLKQAFRAYCDQNLGAIQDARWPGIARRIAADQFDDDTWLDLSARSVQLTRDRGALGLLPLALNNLALAHTFEGDLDTAEVLIEEADTIAHATGGSRITFGRLFLAGFRGDEAGLSAEIETDRAAALARGDGLLLAVGQHVLSLFHNGRGRYEAALAAAEDGSKVDAPCAVWSLPELIEAATRCGDHDRAADALERLTERTQATRTEWALGIEARSRALLNTGTSAAELYYEAIDRLGRSRMAPELARAHLLCGEWLRRENRRIDAREQLRLAYDMLSEMGVLAFAERARRELIATGEKAPKRRAETRDDLTAQEAQIAELARQGYSNPEIGAQLFLSPRTIEWHMRKIFAKLEISSRKELDDVALAARRRRAESA
jgi:DNA-binding CsgD family transcriptional regulator